MQTKFRAAASNAHYEEEGPENEPQHTSQHSNEMRAALKVFVRSRFFTTLIHSVPSQKLCQNES